MRKHAPMWETELGLDDGVNDVEVFARKFHDELEEQHQAGTGSTRASWPQLLLFTVAVVMFLAVAMGLPFRG